MDDDIAVGRQPYTPPAILWDADLDDNPLRAFLRADALRPGDVVLFSTLRFVVEEAWRQRPALVVVCAFQKVACDVLIPGDGLVEMLTLAPGPRRHPLMLAVTP